jgi:hypothetical protein
VAYFRNTIENFLTTDDENIIAKLNAAYANDGFYLSIPQHRLPGI